MSSKPQISHWISLHCNACHHRQHQKYIIALTVAVEPRNDSLSGAPDVNLRFVLVEHSTVSLRLVRLRIRNNRRSRIENKTKEKGKGRKIKTSRIRVSSVGRSNYLWIQRRSRNSTEFKPPLNAWLWKWRPVPHKYIAASSSSTWLQKWI